MNEMKQLEALGLPNVDEILKNKYSFFVPKYQRGYRWTEDQAKKLMYDLYDFDNEESEDEDEELDNEESEAEDEAFSMAM